MHNIEPYYNWLDFYSANNDPNSPFYGKEYSEFEFSDKIYNYVIHPQWDNMGSSTLFVKILFCDYEDEFCVIELIGEWNDCIENDIMTLTRELLEPMLENGIKKFILIGENVLNFFGSDDEYYAEFNDSLENGWVALINFLPHVLQEMSDTNIDQYWIWGGELDDMNWRKLKAQDLLSHLEDIIGKRIG